MELSGEAWAALTAIGGVVTAAVAYLIKGPMDANRDRQKRLEANAEEVAQLQKEYIKTATESSQLNAATNAKQATDLAQQAMNIGVMATALGTVSDNTKTIHSVLREGTALFRVLIKQLPSIDDQNVAQQHLNEIVSILGHKR